MLDSPKNTVNFLYIYKCIMKSKKLHHGEMLIKKSNFEV